jgi:hypothetical protein
MTMHANEVIDSYVTDVVLQLPRKQRNDVAFELRALINEALQDKADDSGRVVDGAMAIEFLQGFGAPVEVAARYRPTLTVIDPVDGHRFVRWAVIGMAVIWVLGLMEKLSQPMGSTAEFLGAIGQWLAGSLVASLWWPGVLVVWFGMASRERQRSSRAATAWQPRAGDRITGGRTGLVMGLIGIVCGVLVLMNPHWVLDFFWRGQAAPAAYQALTYTESFLQRQAPWLLGLILVNIPIFIIAIVQGRWSTTMRRVMVWLSLAMCAVMMWTVLDGPIFMSSASDHMTKSIMTLIVAITLIDLAIKLYRRVRPAPGGQVRIG